MRGNLRPPPLEFHLTGTGLALSFRLLMPRLMATSSERGNRANSLIQRRLPDLSLSRLCLRFSSASNCPCRKSFRSAARISASSLLLLAAKHTLARRQALFLSCLRRSADSFSDLSWRDSSSRVNIAEVQKKYFDSFKGSRISSRGFQVRLRISPLPTQLSSVDFASDLVLLNAANPDQLQLGQLLAKFNHLESSKRYACG